MKQRRKRSRVVGVDGKPHYPRTYDARWAKFSNFLEDMGLRPLGCTLDRIDPFDGVYYKANCRWATRQQQDYNRTDTVLFYLEPDSYKVAGSALDWAEHFSGRTGIPMSVEEFKTIVKFFTVRQLWSAIHPSALSVQQLRDRHEAEKLAAHEKEVRELIAAVQPDC